MSLSIDDQIRSIRRNDHACMIYEDEEEQLAAVVPFIKAGLEHNELCLYIADDNSVRRLQDALQAGGIDVAAERAAGRLLLLTPPKAYLRDGAFDPDQMITFLDEQVQEALHDGFSGLRITGEMSWALGLHEGSARLIEYEAKLNSYFADHPVVAISLYNRRRFSPPVIRDILRTHPVAVLGNQVCSNLYYEPPELLLNQKSDDFRVDWMIRQLKQIRSYEQALEEANHMLESSNARKDEFLAMLGHELRNPLAAINNGIALLGLGTLDSHRTADVQRTIEHQMRNITHLVDDLLDVARVTRGKISLSRQSVDLTELVRRVTEEYRDDMTAKQIELRLQLSDEPLRVYGDETRLEQVVGNLLENAIKFTAVEGRVTVSLDQNDEEIILKISDTGVGMPADLLEHAFELFAQGERGLSRAEGGLGIGLTLARTLTELHGGRIRADSPGKNQGSTVSVHLPAITPAEEAHAPLPPEVQPATAHLLLVEDNEAVAQTLSMLIEQLGQRVTLAYTGERALEQAKEIIPDLVLLDIGLPGIDGYEVCRRLRALYGPRVPIYALTGYGRSERMDEARFTGYCKKPLSLSNLLDLINKVRHDEQQGPLRSH